MTWDTSWIADQGPPVRIMARVVDKNGLCVMTQAVKCRFVRERRAVRMLQALDVHEGFNARGNLWKTCRFDIPPWYFTGSPGVLKRARIAVSTWSGEHAEALGINGQKLVDRVGRIHDWSIDWIDVPVSALRAGDNIFYAYSATKEHGAEINWPGPALYLEFEKPPATSAPATSPAEGGK